MVLTETRIIKETSNGYNAISIRDDMLSRRQIECVGEINDALVNSLIEQLLFLQHEDPDKEVTMYINSPGGNVDSGMALYDVMRAVSYPIKTICMGLAASMASLIFISGTTRDMLPHSRIMIHDPLITQTGGSALRLKAVSDDLMETRQIIAGVIAKHSGKSLEEILEKTSSDCFFRAHEAIEFGLADNIVTSL